MRGNQILLPSGLLPVSLHNYSEGALTGCAQWITWVPHTLLPAPVV